MKNKRKKNIVGLGTLLIMIMQISIPALAGESASSANDIANQVLAPVMILKTILIAGAGVVGIVIVIKGVIDLGTAIPQQDSTGISMAVRELIGGGIITAVDIILGIFTI